MVVGRKRVPNDEGRWVYRVIDTIEYRNSWIFRYPELQKHGEGVSAILDFDGPIPPTSLAGNLITLHRPDGMTMQLRVESVEFGGGGVPSFFFKGISVADIPRGSVFFDERGS